MCPKTVANHVEYIAQQFLRPISIHLRLCDDLQLSTGRPKTTFLKSRFFCLRNFSASSYNIGDTGKEFVKPCAQRLSSYDFLKLCHRKHTRERVTITSHAKHSKPFWLHHVDISINISINECMRDVYRAQMQVIYCCQC